MARFGNLHRRPGDAPLRQCSNQFRSIGLRTHRCQWLRGHGHEEITDERERCNHLRSAVATRRAASVVEGSEMSAIVSRRSAIAATRPSTPVTMTTCLTGQSVGTVASTAVGVVAGSMLYQGIGSLMGNRNNDHAANPPGGGKLAETDYGNPQADAGYAAEDFDTGGGDMGDVG